MPYPSIAQRLLGVILLYLAAAQGGLMVAVVGSTVSLVWAPSGIALAALLLYGRRMALGVFLGAFAANAWTGIPLPAALSIALGNVLEALAGAWLLGRLAQQPGALGSLRDVLVLIVGAALLSTTLSAAVGVATLTWIGAVEPADAATVGLKWWLGDMMGVLVVTPLLLLLHGRLRWPTRREALEGLCLFAALTGVGLKIFGASGQSAQGYYASSLAVFPFVIWAALRFDQWGASLVSLLVSVLAIWGTAQGLGPFVEGDPVDSLVRWCAFGIVTAVTGLLLAAAVAEQRQSYNELEQRVLERTQELAAASAEGRRLETALIGVSEAQQQALGRELHDGLGQMLTSLSLMCASVQQRLQARAQPEAEALQRIAEVIAQASEMTRSVARGLYPVALEFGGINAALEQLAEHTRVHLRQDCVFEVDPHLHLHDPLVAVNLYRVAQEAVNNAVKHGRGGQIRIALARAGAENRLSISDDGRGLPQQPAADLTPGLGLASMRFRARQLGGRLEIEPRLPRGTTISVSYPP